MKAITRKKSSSGGWRCLVPAWLCFFVFLIPLVLVGCGKKHATSQNTLRVAISTDVFTWCPDRFPGGDTRFVWAQVYETLVRLDHHLRLQPGLATRWESADGGRVWTFHLRPNVTFHDGSPLTAKVVAASYGPNTYARRTVLRAIDKIEAVNDQTVRFHLKRPMPLPYYMTHVGWPVVGEATLRGEGVDAPAVGTGPFVVDRVLAGQRIVLRRYEHYWGERPHVERVVFEVIPDGASRVTALESGGVDMILKVPEVDIARLQARPNLRVERTLSTFTDFIQFNCRRKPLSDLRLRRAIAAAIDTRALVRSVLNNVGQPARGWPLSPLMLYALPGQAASSRDTAQRDAIRFDPAKAKNLLKQAGWRDSDGDGIVDRNGKPLVLTALVSKNANVAAGSRFVSMAEAVQTALKNVGINLRIRVLESGAFLQEEKEGRFDLLFRTGYYVWGCYPRHFFIHESKNPYSHYSDAEYDALAERADSTIDPDQQKRFYERLQYMTIERLPAFYLVHQEKVVALRKRVAGYEISPEPAWLNLRGVSLVDVSNSSGEAKAQRRE